jgi:hypothetical protein
LKERDIYTDQGVGVIFTDHTYDTLGNRINSTSSAFKIAGYYSYTYDSNGYLIKREAVDLYTSPGEVTSKNITYYTYDANGNLIKSEEDRGEDGTIDTVIYNTYQRI